MQRKLTIKPIVLAVAMLASSPGFAAPVFVNHLTVSGGTGGADNDFSVIQNDDDVQFDVCTDGLTAQQVGLDRACPAGLSLLPSYLYSFKADGLNYVQPQAVPEPRVAMLMALGLAGIGTMRANPRKSK